MKACFIALMFAFLGNHQDSTQSFFRNIKTSQADKVIQQNVGKGTLIILDVRKPGEFDNGHIRGAINIDFWNRSFVDSVSKLDKEKIILVYCTSGIRSGNAMKKLRSAGFGRIYNLKGGLIRWQSAKLPLVKGAGVR